MNKLDHLQLLKFNAHDSRKQRNYGSKSTAIYPRNDRENWVWCHNNIKPEHILFDGKCAWLVDWEAAFLNDRYLVLAMLANFVIKDEHEEAGFLEIYFGEPADEYKRARFLVMNQQLQIFYLIFFLLSASVGKPIDPGSIYTPCFRDFHERLWELKSILATTSSTCNIRLFI